MFSKTFRDESRGKKDLQLQNFLQTYHVVKGKR